MRAQQFFASIFCVLTACAAVHAADPPQVDLAQLAERGRATLKRLTKEPATWTAMCRLETGTIVRVTVTVAGDRRRKVVELRSGVRWLPVLQIIERDGLWYATRDASARKCRPFELPTDGPTTYIILEGANPAFVIDPQQVADAKLQEVNNGVAVFRFPLDPGAKAHIAGILAQFADLKQKSGQPYSPDSVKVIRRLEDQLEHGTASHVDLATGVFVEFGSSKIWTQIKDFRFLPKAPAGAFDVDDRKWEDYTDDPTLDAGDNLVLFGYDPNYAAGGQAGNSELQIMDIRTGRFRRVPFPGFGAAGGCFLGDRKSVLVHGISSDSGGLIPFRVNLQSGKTSAIAPQTFLNSNTLGATLSPDGRTAALLKLSVGGGFLKHQIYLIDLATEKATPLGEPLGAAYLSWMPDGKQLLLRISEYKDLNSKATYWVATMDLRGKLTKLLSGDAPLLIGNPPRILLEDRDTRLWSTCDLDGKNAEPYASGLLHYGFPTVSPDGRQLLMMFFETGKTPVPTVLDYGKSSGRAVPHAPGLWSQPAWK